MLHETFPHKNVELRTLYVSTSGRKLIKKKKKSFFRGDANRQDSILSKGWAFQYNRNDIENVVKSVS